MAKQRILLSNKTPLTAFLVVTALGWFGECLPQVRAGQEPAMGALQYARKMQEPLQKKDSAPPPASQTSAPANGALDEGPKGAPSADTEVETTRRADFGVGKRDPFKLPPPPPTGGRVSEGIPESTGPLPAGNRGLVVSQIRLQGVVRQDVSNKMLAVVTNETKRAYFLTENESVYNGVVSKITPDAVYFKENVLDREGKVTIREVVRRLGPAPGEGR